MKIFICLLSVFQFVLSGGVPVWSSGPSIVESNGLHGHSGNHHGFGGGQQVYKVILIDGGKSAYSGHGASHSYSGGHSEVYKIHELGHGSSSGHHYDSSHSHASFSLNALLPQILKIILEGNSFGDNGHDVNNQLTSAYHHEGLALVTRTKGQPNHDLKGGHVIQKGTLEVTRTVHNGGSGGKFGGGSSW